MESHTRDLSGLAQGSLAGLLQFAVAMYLLFHLLHDRTSLREGARRFLPMSRAESDQVAVPSASGVGARAASAAIRPAASGP